MGDFVEVLPAIDDVARTCGLKSGAVLEVATSYEDGRSVIVNHFRPDGRGCAHLITNGCPNKPLFRLLSPLRYLALVGNGIIVPESE